MQSIIDFIVGSFKLMIFLAFVIVVLVAWGYNKLRRLSEGVNEALSNISVAARKKVALINELIDVVRGYQESEKLVMLKASEDASVASLQRTYKQSGTVLAQITGMAQRFPDLKANQQYQMLIQSIQGAELDLENARKAYNHAVKVYNVARTSIPQVFFSTLVGFKKAEFLSLEAQESGDVTAQRPLISDDGERVAELLDLASKRAFAAAQGLGEQGKAIFEKGAARVRHAGSSEAFTYLDQDRNPHGPISRAELDSLVQTGVISNDTNVLKAGSGNWTKYKDL